MQKTKRKRMNNAELIRLSHVMASKREDWEPLIADDLRQELTDLGYQLSIHQVRQLRKTMGWKRVYKPSGMIARLRKDNDSALATMNMVLDMIEALVNRQSKADQRINTLEAALEDLKQSSGFKRFFPMMDAKTRTNPVERVR